jgi:hypothetical protein
MKVLIHTPNHYGHGGEVGVVGILVRVLAFKM